jgi:excisionase family DNA binding protein
MSDTYSTLEVARMLGMAVRSVQLMVDRGELTAWKTPGGHRRILRESVERWRAARGIGPAGALVVANAASPATSAATSLTTSPASAPATAPAATPQAAPAAAAQAAPPPNAAAGLPAVLLIEDSKHFQNLISLLVRQHFPGVRLHVADDGIAGLAMAGQIQPRVLIVDILLPGIDGAALISSLRLHPQFAGMRLVVVTSLDEQQREPYAFALQGVPVIHKPRLVAELPPLLRAVLEPGPPDA